MRPDAHRFLRPDWRRYVQPGSELARQYAELEAKYRPDQPRVPAGRREGGQWMDEGGVGGQSTDNGEAEPQEDTSDRIIVAGSVIPICIVEAKVLYGDGTYKVIYICADGRTITRIGVGRRIPGVIRQPD